MTKRTFTIKEADTTLPLVRRIAEDVARSYHALSEQAGKYKEIRRARERDREAEELLNELKAAMGVLSREIEDFVAELTEIGCEMKDLKSGTVDFPSELDGRRIFLCWQPGEDRVEHWHEVTEGFAGRKPFPVAVQEE